MFTDIKKAPPPLLPPFIPGPPCSLPSRPIPPLHSHAYSPLLRRNSHSDVISKGAVFSLISPLWPSPRSRLHAWTVGDVRVRAASMTVFMQSSSLPPLSPSEGIPQGLPPSPLIMHQFGSAVSRTFHLADRNTVPTVAFSALLFLSSSFIFSLTISL